MPKIVPKTVEKSAIDTMPKIVEKPNFLNQSQETANATDIKQQQAVALNNIAEGVKGMLFSTFYEDGAIKNADSVKGGSLDENIAKINATFLNLWKAAYEQHNDNKELIDKVKVINGMIGEVQMGIFGFQAKFNGKLGGFAGVDTKEKADAVIAANTSEILKHAHYTENAPLYKSVEDFTLSMFSEFTKTFKGGASGEGAGAQTKSGQPNVIAPQDTVKGTSEKDAEALAEAQRHAKAERYKKSISRAERLQAAGSFILHSTALELLFGLGAATVTALHSLEALPEFGKVFAGITVGWVSTGFFIRKFGDLRVGYAKRKAAEVDAESREMQLEEYKMRIEGAKERAEKAGKNALRNAKKGVIGGLGGLGATAIAGAATYFYAPAFLNYVVISGMALATIYMLDQITKTFLERHREKRETKTAEKLEIEKASMEIKASARD